MDCRDQPVFVTANIEHDKLADKIGRVKRLPYFCKVSPFGVLRNLIPSLERSLRFRIRLREFAKFLLRKYPHDISTFSQNHCGYPISQIAKLSRRVLDLIHLRVTMTAA